MLSVSMDFAIVITMQFVVVQGVCIAVVFEILESTNFEDPTYFHAKVGHKNKPFGNRSGHFKDA